MSYYQHRSPEHYQVPVAYTVFIRLGRHCGIECYLMATAIELSHNGANFVSQESRHFYHIHNNDYLARLLINITE